MLHVAADERVAEGPVQEGVAGQVEDTEAHQVDPFGFVLSREHGEADVLWERRGGGHPEALSPPQPLPSTANAALPVCGH